MSKLHHSLYEELAAELDKPLPAPPCAIFDHHMHLGSVADTAVYLSAARAYGVSKALGISSLEQARAMRREFGNFFFFCGWPLIRSAELTPRLVDSCIAEIERMREEGFVALKFRIVPDRDGLAPKVWLDDKRLKPLFDRAEKLGFSVQAHIAQPDVWFEKYYGSGLAGPKEHYFRQVEYLLETHPGFDYVGVHMGGHPENLDYLDDVMERFERFHIDTSATKWTVRELSRRHEEAREFFIRRADRILFGSDLVVRRGVASSYYTSRFHVQRVMWETSFRGRSMIKDPDSRTHPVIHALDLPADVLKKVYWENAARILGVAEEPAP